MLKKNEIEILKPENEEVLKDLLKRYNENVTDEYKIDLESLCHNVYIYGKQGENLCSREGHGKGFVDIKTFGMIEVCANKRGIDPKYDRYNEYLYYTILTL